MKLIVSEATAGDIVRFVKYDIIDSDVVGSLLIKLEKRMPDEVHLKMRIGDGQGDAKDES